jgi:hypothetical protein
MPALIRVRDVLEALTRWQPRLLSDPETADLVVRGPAALDPRELADSGGSVVLAAGIGPSGAAEFVARSRALGAALVVVRADDLDSVSPPPAEASSALISLAAPGPWREIDASIDVLLRSSDAAPIPGLNVRATGDLFALANAVAAVVGGAVTVEDPEMRVLAYSSWPQHEIDDLRRRVILERQVPKDVSPDQYRQLMREHRVLRFHGEGQGYPRIAVAVRAAGRLLGFLWVLEVEPFGDTQLDALARAGEVAAAHFLRFFEINSPDREYRAESIRRVLDGQATSRDVELLRLGGQASFMVAAFRCVLPPESSSEVVTNRLAELAGVYLADAGGMSAIAVEDDTVHVLLRTSAEPQALEPMIERFVKQAEAALNVRVYSGLGRRVKGPREVPVSRQEADLVVGTLARYPCNQPVARLDDVLDQAMLEAFLDLLVERPELRHRGVEALIDRDMRKGGMLAATLLTFLHSNGDYQAVADQLHIHVNTVRYRIEKACQQSGLDLDDALQRFAVWVQLIAQLRERSTVPA